MISPPLQGRNIVSLIQSTDAGHAPGSLPVWLLLPRPWSRLPAHSRPAQFARRTQASLAHDYSGLHGEGDMHIGFGIMGGWNQAQAQLQFVAEGGSRELPGCMEAPRFTKDAFEGLADVLMEETIPADIRAGLTQRGHEIKLLEPLSFRWDRGRPVVRDTPVRSTLLQDALRRAYPSRAGHERRSPVRIASASAAGGFHVWKDSSPFRARGCIPSALALPTAAADIVIEHNVAMKTRDGVTLKAPS